MWTSSREQTTLPRRLQTPSEVSRALPAWPMTRTLLTSLSASLSLRAMCATGFSSTCNHTSSNSSTAANARASQCGTTAKSAPRSRNSPNPSSRSSRRASHLQRELVGTLAIWSSKRCLAPPRRSKRRRSVCSSSSHGHTTRRASPP